MTNNSLNYGSSSLQIQYLFDDFLWDLILVLSVIFSKEYKSHDKNIKFLIALWQNIQNNI